MLPACLRFAGRRVRFLLLASCLAAQAAAAAEIVRSGGPYVPTPQAVVDEMLDLAGVTSDDYVMDLGSGDGRIVLTAADRFQSRGKGVDIDPELVEQSTKAARQRNLDGLVQFEAQDALKARIADATVLTLYLLPELMHQLRERIYNELKPGARVVSHDFRFNDWAPDRSVTLDVPEKYGSSGAFQSTIYLWVVPAKAAGRWQATVEGDKAESYVLSFTQVFQRIEGEAIVGGRRLKIEGARLEGNRIRFVIVDNGRSHHFEGRVDGIVMSGTVRSGIGSALTERTWRAERVLPIGENS